MTPRITKICPTCNARLSVSANQTGKNLHCPKCLRSIVLSADEYQSSIVLSADEYQSSIVLSADEYQSSIELPKYQSQTKVVSAPKNGWPAQQWLPTVIALFAIGLAGSQMLHQRQSRIDDRNTIGALIARLETCEQTILRTEDLLEELEQNAGFKDALNANNANNADSVLLARLWRAQDAIDETADYIGQLYHALNPRLFGIPGRRNTRIFETPEAEADAKQFADVDKQANAEARKAAAEARKNAKQK